MVERKRILVVDPFTGGGIRQATNYLVSYLRKRYAVKLFSFGTLNSPAILFTFLLQIVESFKPDLVIVHDTSRYDAFSFVKAVHPEIRFAYMSLCVNGFSDPSFISPYDYFIGPNAPSSSLSSHYNSRVSKVEWIFGLPERFSSRVPFEKRKLELFFAGRVIQAKINLDFIKKLSEFNAVLHVFGDRMPEDPQFNKAVLGEPSIVYKGSVPNGMLHEIMNSYCFAVLPSNEDCFSLSILESILCGQIPIVLRRFRKDYVWSNDMTKQFFDPEDLLDCYREMLSTPISLLQGYRDCHLERVQAWLKPISSFDKMDSLLESPAPNKDFFDQKTIWEAGAELV